MTRLITPSTETRIETGVSILWHVLIGLALLLGGGAGVAYTLEHAHDGHTDHPMIYFFGSIALVGCLILPSIFDVFWPRVVKIYVQIFPNGLPLIGGRRASDPPAEPKP